MVGETPGKIPGGVPGLLTIEVPYDISPEEIANRLPAVKSGKFDAVPVFIQIRSDTEFVAPNQYRLIDGTFVSEEEYHALLQGAVLLHNVIDLRDMMRLRYIERPGEIIEGIRAIKQASKDHNEASQT